MKEQRKDAVSRMGRASGLGEQASVGAERESHR